MSQRNFSTSVKELVSYTEKDEYRNLLEHLESDSSISKNGKFFFDEMSEEELYAFCIDHDVNHIWTSIYEVKSGLEFLIG